MHLDLHPSSEAPRSLAGRALVIAAVALLVVAGLFLWGSRGDAVFGDVVLAALAWCF